METWTLTAYAIRKSHFIDGSCSAGLDGGMRYQELASWVPGKPGIGTGTLRWKLGTSPYQAHARIGGTQHPRPSTLAPRTEVVSRHIGR